MQGGVRFFSGKAHLEDKVVERVPNFPSTQRTTQRESQPVCVLRVTTIGFIAFLTCSGRRRRLCEAKEAKQTTNVSARIVLVCIYPQFLF